MKPHPRIRKFFKWGGLVVSVLLLVVILESAVSRYRYNGQSGDSLTLTQGYLEYRRSQSRPQRRGSGVRHSRVDKPKLVWSPQWPLASGAGPYIIPLWPFVAISIATTAAAWRMDTLAQRSQRPGVCPACGYDRTGLAADAPCPECNAKA